MSSFDMDKLMQQAAQMQDQMQRMQDEATQETAQSSVGGDLEYADEVTLGRALAGRREM